MRGGVEARFADRLLPIAETGVGTGSDDRTAGAAVPRAGAELVLEVALGGTAGMRQRIARKAESVAEPGGNAPFRAVRAVFLAKWKPRSSSIQSSVSSR
jgi:hypothetical protein